NDVHWSWFGADIFWFRTYSEELFWNLIGHIYQSIDYVPPRDVTTSVATLHAGETTPIPPTLIARRLEKNVRLASHALGLNDVPYIFFLQPTLPVTQKALSPRERQALQEEGRVYDEVILKYFKDSYGEIRATLGSLHEENFQFRDLSSVFDDRRE